MKILSSNLTPNGELKYGNRPLFITVYDTNSVVATIEDIDKIDKYERNRIMFSGHFFVRKDGSVYSGRPIPTFGEFGKNDKGFNFDINNIGICIEGNFDIELMNTIQKQSVNDVIDYLKENYQNLRCLYSLNELIPNERPGYLFPINNFKKHFGIDGSSDEIVDLQGNTSYKFGSRELFYVPANPFKGNDVSTLQYMLLSLGYSEIDNTGIFSKRCRNVLIRFQSDNQLNPTGILDNDTLSLINKLILWKEATRDGYGRVLYLESSIDLYLYGEDIRLIQKRLNLLGYTCEETGFYDKDTSKAVLNFQQYRALKSDGRVGPITWNYIMGGDIQFITRTLKYSTPMLYGDDIRLVQERLIEIGFKVEVTNWYDLNTANAIREFQLKHNLTQNGEVTPELAEILFK